MPRRSTTESDSGETLIELIVAIAIMGIAAVAIVGSITTAVLVSNIHRNQGTAGYAVRGYAEAIENYVASGNYVDCATANSYLPAAVGYAPPAGFAVSTYSVQYWTGTTWGSCGSPDSGIQQVTVTVRSLDLRAAESVTVVLRKLCGIGSSCA